MGVLVYRMERPFNAVGFLLVFQSLPHRAAGLRPTGELQTALLSFHDHDESIASAHVYGFGERHPTAFVGHPGRDADFTFVLRNIHTICTGVLACGNVGEVNAIDPAFLSESEGEVRFDVKRAHHGFGFQIAVINS